MEPPKQPQPGGRGKGGAASGPTSRRSRRSKSPLRRRKNSKSPQRRQRSFSPLRFFKKGGESGGGGGSSTTDNHQTEPNVHSSGPANHNNSLHIVPEALYEGSSDSFQFTQSAAFRQEQMIQAFAMTSIAEPEDALASSGRTSLPLGSEQSSSMFSGQFSSDSAFMESVSSDERFNPDYCNKQENTDTEIPLRSPSQPRKQSSLDKLQELPEYYTTGSSEGPSSSGGSLTTNSRISRSTRHSGTSSTIEGGDSHVSRLSFNSMTSNNSMPSLSSIVEHDLVSVGTFGHSETSSITTNLSIPSVPTGQTGNDTSSSPDKKPPARQGSRRIIPILTNPSSTSTPPKEGDDDDGDDHELLEHHHEKLKHLEGTTLDYFGPKFEKEQKEAQERWESDAVSKLKTVAKVTPGNSTIAPLTHNQKQILPSRQDVLPQAVPRASGKQQATSLHQQYQQQQLRNTFSTLLERPPPTTDRPTYTAINDRDTVPVVARRFSSSSLLEVPSPLSSASQTIGSESLNHSSVDEKHKSSSTRRKSTGKDRSKHPKLPL